MPTIQKVQREPIQQVPPENIAQFSVEQYHAMIDAGVFDENHNYELLNEIANKVKLITGIQTDLQDEPFLQTVLRDHAHLATGV